MRILWRCSKQGQRSQSKKTKMQAAVSANRRCVKGFRSETSILALELMFYAYMDFDFTFRSDVSFSSELPHQPVYFQCHP